MHKTQLNNHKQRELYIDKLNSNTNYTLTIYYIIITTTNKHNLNHKYKKLLSETYKTSKSSANILISTTQSNQIINCKYNTNHIYVAYQLNNIKSNYNINKYENVDRYFYLNKYLLPPQTFSLSDDDYTNHVDFELINKNKFETINIINNRESEYKYKYKLQTPLSQIESISINFNLIINNKIYKYITFKCDYIDDTNVNDYELISSSDNNENDADYYFNINNKNSDNNDNHHTTSSITHNRSRLSTVATEINSLISFDSVKLIKKFELNEPVIVNCVIRSEKQFQLKLQHNQSSLLNNRNINEDQLYYKIEYRLSNQHHLHNKFYDNHEFKNITIKKESQLQVSSSLIILLETT